MTQILDGKKVAASVKRQVLESLQAHIPPQGKPACLAVILVGEDPASKIYVANKEKAAKELGIKSLLLSLPQETSQEALLKEIEALNQNPQVHGILLQLPLPKHLDQGVLLEAIDPDKDVDGFHPVNLGRLLQKDERIVPCTPKGILTLLEAYHIDLVGKKMVIVGQSTIVGRPMALLGLNHGATVTVCHSKTQNLSQETSQADILIMATGAMDLIGPEGIKPGAVVIDVGMNRTPEGKLRGDLDFESIAPLASAMTPVPGGVGPMTIAMLMQQTLTNYLKLEGLV